MSAPFPFTCRPLQGLVMAAAAALLVACGGDDDDAGATASTLQGVAAIGTPIAGAAVQVRCAGGSALDTTTSANGRWQVAVSGQTLPCAVQVSGGTVGGVASELTLHSLATAFGNLNITPLTDLVVANQIGGDPQAWFAAPAFAGIDAASLDAAAARVATALGISGALGNRDPLTASFEPVAGDPIDDVLEALGSALQALGQGYAALLAAAGAGDFTAFAGLPAAVANALGNNGGGGGGGSTTCSSGVQMTFAAGQAAGPYTNGQEVCVEASATTLKIDAMTLTNPTQNTAVTPPYSAYKYTDAGFDYEVVLNNGALYEINVSKVNAASAADFHGQFTPSAGSGGVTMTLEVTVNGIAAASIQVPNQVAPANQAEFCADIQNDPNLVGVQVQSGVTLTITGCSFANNTGTVSATAQVSGISVPYVVRFIYGS